MADPGYPFQGGIWYSPEATYKGTPRSTATFISDKVQDVRIDTGDVVRTLRDISSASVCGFVETGGDFTLHVEWVYQPNDDSLATFCVNRDSAGDLTSLYFEVVANEDRTNKTYYQCGGCKAKNFNVSARRGEEYIASADFSVGTVWASSAVSVTKPTATIADAQNGTRPYASFNAAGNITFTGGFNAFITDSIDITVENNLSDYWNVGSTSKIASIPGAQDITGSADLSLDQGGLTPWRQIADLVSDITSLEVNTGRTSGQAGKITLLTGKYNNLSVDQNVSGNTMMSSIPFTFKKLEFSVGT